MARNKDGVHKQIGFIKANDGIKKEGANPLSFNSKNTKKIDYTIYGNTMQKTYTGKNLFDFNSGDYTTTGSIGTLDIDSTNEKIKFTLTNGQNNYGFNIIRKNIVLEPGTYTISGTVIDACTIDPGNDGFRVAINDVWGSATGQSNTFTIAEGDTLNIAFYVGMSNTGEGYVEVSNIQLEAGSTATEYEPYVGGVASPNPNYPQEVVGVGDKTANLYSWDGNLLGSSDLTVSENDSVISSVIDVRGVDTVYFTGDSTLLNSGVYRISKSDTPIDVDSTIKTYDTTFAGGVYDVSDCNYLLITASVYNMPQENAELIKNTFMLNIGDTPLPYEPYGKYKIPVECRGKNLLKLKDDYVADVRGVSVSIKNGTLTINGTASSSGGRTVYLSETHVLKAGTYTLSSTPVSELRYCLSKVADGSPIVVTYKTGTFTLTEDVSVAFGLNVLNGTTYDATVNVMLELGAESTEYEPYTEYPTVIYHDRPIYSIGDYADYINSGAQSVDSRLVKELVLTGDEWWRNMQDREETGEANSHGIYTFYMLLPHTGSAGYCTHCIKNETTYSNVTNESFSLLNSERLYIRVSNSRTRSYEEFIDWLKGQYNAGTPVKVYYITAEPEVTEITEELPEIPLIKGTNVLSVNTEVSPSKLSVYRADTEIDCVKNAEGEILFERGFTREACDALPLQFNGMGKNLKDYTIYGNTEQKTYTGKNLFDIDDITVDTYLNQGDGVTYESTFSNTSGYIPVSGGNVTISARLSDTLMNDGTRDIAFYDSSKTYIAGTTISADLSQPITVAINEGASFIRFAYDKSCSDVQLELGSTATSYEPYVGGMASPNPNYPQEVIAVGDKTPNLFDKNDCTVEGYINADGNLATVTGSNWFTTENYIKCSGVITLSTSQGLGGTTYVACYDKQKNLLGTVLIGGDNPTQNTVTLVDGTEYIKTCARDNAFADYMLNEGDTALPYEPYGYRVPITTKGKNLIGIEPFEAAWVTGMSTTGLLELLNRLNIGTYKISYKTKLLTRTDVSDSSVYGMSIRNESKNYTYNPSWGSSVVGDIKDYSITINISEAEVGKFTATYLYGCGTYVDGATGSAQIYDFQLEYGDTATEYEPYTPTQFVTNAYLDEPIYKIGDYSDEINYKGKTAERVVKELVLTGSEYWQIYSHTDNSVHQFFTDIPDKDTAPSISGTSAFSTITPYGVTATNRVHYAFGCYPVVSGTCVAFQMWGAKDRFTGISAWKAYLAEQYEAGTPVKIYYVLAEPVTESITLPDVPTLNGGNVLDVDTTVEPALMTIDYKTEDPSPKPQALRLSNLEILTTADGTVLETRM